MIYTISHTEKGKTFKYYIEADSLKQAHACGRFLWWEGASYSTSETPAAVIKTLSERDISMLVKKEG